MRARTRAAFHATLGRVGYKLETNVRLDRVLDPEHAFALTRKTPATADQLHDFLAAQAASINR